MAKTFVSGKEVKKWFVGGREVKKAYFNGQLVFSSALGTNGENGSLGIPPTPQAIGAAGEATRGTIT